MGKKMKLKSSWPWPVNCHQPRTVSFRSPENHHYNFEFYNERKTESSCFTNSSEESTLSNESSAAAGQDCLESMIQELKSSERLFFEPGETSPSILAKEATHDDGGGDGEEENDNCLIKKSVVLSMESQDPYLDFKKSMEEMVEANLGMKESWEDLEELLSCFLRVNPKSNHGYIVAAFVDLLVGFSSQKNVSSPSSSSSSSSPKFCYNISPASPLSFCTTSTTNTTSSDQEEVHSVTSFFSSLQLLE